MRENNIDLVACHLCFHIGFDGFGGLFVLPPTCVATNTPVGINAVSTADHKVTLTFNIVNLTVFSKKNAGVGIFNPYLTTVPIDKTVGRYVFGTAFVVSVDTENRAFYGIQTPFAFVIKFIQIVVSSHITEDDQHIVSGYVDVFCEVYHAPRLSVDIASYINHNDLLL